MTIVNYERRQLLQPVIVDSLGMNTYQDSWDRLVS